MRDGLAGMAIGALAVICCAALPLVAGVAGGVAIGVVLGVGAGVAALVALASAIMLVVRARRRRGRSLDASGHARERNAAHGR
jgi:hypothetical protein